MMPTPSRFVRAVFAVTCLWLTHCDKTPDAVDLEGLQQVAHFSLDSPPRGAAYQVVLQDGLLYARSAYGLEIFRLNHGDDAEHLSTFTVQPSSHQILQHLAVKGALVALGHGARVVLLDVSDPTAPRELSVLTVSSGLGQLVLDDHYLWFANGGAGVKRTDVSDPAHPGFPVSVSPDNAEAVLVKDGHAYAAGSTVHVMTLLPGGGITVDGAVSLSNVGAMVHKDHHLLATVGEQSEVAVVDVADPKAPQVLQRGVGLGRVARGLALVGNQLLVPALNGLLYDVDVSDPATPRNRGFLDPHLGSANEELWDVAVDDTFVVLAHGTGVYIYRR
jgi:hypothetical protein